MNTHESYSMSCPLTNYPHAHCSKATAPVARDVTPGPESGLNVRTTVHEYGGGGASQFQTVSDGLRRFHTDPHGFTHFDDMLSCLMESAHNTFAHPPNNVACLCHRLPRGGYWERQNHCLLLQFQVRYAPGHVLLL